MASTQKKTTKGKKAPPKPEPPAYNGMARLIGGIVCLLLALCVLVSYFNVDALLLTFIAKALKGTLGCGYYLAAPALLGVAVIQLRHQGRPVILRTTCTLLVPLLAGVLWHLIFCRSGRDAGGNCGKMNRFSTISTVFSTSFAQKWKNKRAFEAFCGKTSWKSRGKGWKTSPLWGKPVESEKSAPKEA